MNIEFSSFGNKAWSMTDNGIVCGTMMIAFNTIKHFGITDTTTSLVNGQINLLLMNGEEHRFFFSVKQRFDAHKVMEELRSRCGNNAIDAFADKEKSSTSVFETMDNKMLYSFDGGLKDTLEIYEDNIVIKHKGMLNAMAMGVKGDKVLYYEDITAVQFKKPSKLVTGYIQFSLKGGRENIGGVISAMSDENSVAVGAGYDGIIARAEKAVEIINSKLREVKTKSNQPTQVVSNTSGADEILKYKQLLDMGVISQEEFDAKKKQLLGL